MSDYWECPNITDWDDFAEKVEEICELNGNAVELAEQGIQVISCDEKPGIQALQRAAPSLPLQQGHIEKQEYNYIRHGTLTLIANLLIATGKLIAPSIGPTRTEIDFLEHIKQTVALDPLLGWVIIVDQLNIHKSASLVQWVAQQLGDQQDLGKKGVRGILKSMETRMAYLSDCKHRIRFVYTPKHCSWLNLIEGWFSVLKRRTLKRGNFTSKEDLKKKMFAYIDYHNAKLAKTINWATCKKKDVQELINKVKRMVCKFAT